MKRHRSRGFAPVLFCAIALVGTAGAQSDNTAEQALVLDEIVALRDRAEADTASEGEQRTRTLELYNGAISALQQAESDVSKARKFDQERSGVDRLAAALRAELGRPEKGPRVRLPAQATAEQAEGILARESARLKANRSALRDVERRAEERSTSRREISRSLGELDQESESLADALRQATESNLPAALKEATRTQLLARRAAALKRAERLRAELSLLDARGVLVPMQTDQAQRRVSFSEELVALLTTSTEDLRQQEDRESLSRVAAQCAELATRMPELSALAAETSALAETLWGPQGLRVKTVEAGKNLGNTRKHSADLDRIGQLTRRKFDAFGHRGSITRWWPEVPEEFPAPGDVEAKLSALQSRIPEMQHELIRLEQQRSTSRRQEKRLLSELAGEEGGTVSREMELAARELFAVRRDLLDDLIQVHGRYVNRLVELETVARNFYEELELVQSFLYEELLWSRSVPRPVIPRLSKMAGAVGWLLAPANLSDLTATLFRGIRATWPRSLAVLFALIVLLAMRRPLRRRLETTARRVGDPDHDAFRYTPGALLYGVLLAAPIPLVFHHLGRILLVIDASTYVYSAGRAMHLTAQVVALFAVARQFLAPHGLAEAHFGWPSRVTRPVYVGILWRAALFLPLIYVALHLGAAGMRLTSSEELQSHNNSLGRVAFIVAMTILGLGLLNLCRARTELGFTARQGRTGRIYLWAVLVAVTSTLVPAVLAAFGFYISAALLSYQALQTAWLVMLLVILAGMTARWRATRQTQAEGATVPMADSQVRQLVRFVLAIVAGVGLYAMWVPAVPTLRILQRVQIWPTIELLEQEDTVAIPGRDARQEAARSAEESEKGSSKGVAPGGLPLPATSGGTATAAGDGSSSLTLWDLLRSLLSILITFVLVRNLPGLIELTMQRRGMLDSGARIAASTLVRYVTMIIGVSVALGFLGVSWSKIQWLAAALTFGLAFGLQEIVANFVSGLILLVERPIRVGDVITVGNLQGRVSRIQIRATTISLWDRSEMVVPNKEFITQKLVNWTLTDSKRRIDIPLRVAYGADPVEVKEVLVGVARQHPEVNEDPPPQALLLEFGDDALRFELRGFVEFGSGLKTADDLRVAIDRAFRENGIEFALPQLNLRLPPRGDRASGPGDSSQEQAPE